MPRGNVANSKLHVCLNIYKFSSATLTLPPAAPLQYHYHSEPSPSCVTTLNGPAGAHSSIFAIMIDGVPLFGPLGDGGAAPTNLDVCGGHVDSTYGFYHVRKGVGLLYPALTWEREYNDKYLADVDYGANCGFLAHP